MAENQQMRKQAARAKVKRGAVAVIGLGNWGTSLAHGVKASGLELREVVVRKAARGRMALPVHEWSEAALDAEVIWLCVGDDAIEEACAELVRRRGNLRGQTVAHSSGARTAGVLEEARQAGARVASVHPVMTFPSRRVVGLKGVLFGVEAESAACRKRLQEVARALGGEPFRIAAESKGLYHAAGTMASPLLVSALTAAMETARLAGLPREVAAKMTGVLAEATLGNVRKRGAEQSFSGPLARGDAGTIQLHLQALGEHPVLAEVYRALGSHALETLPVKEREVLAGLLAAKPQSGKKPQQRKSTPRSATGRARRAGADTL